MFIMNVVPHLSCHITPLVAIAGYLAHPKQLRINPLLLYFLSVIHNGLLVVFSAWTFVSLSQILINVMNVYNIGLLICFIEFYNRNYIKNKTAYRF